MKTMYLKPADFKSFTIGVGVSVGFMTLSFLINFYGETREQIMRSRTKKIAPIIQQAPVYTEVPGMN